MMILNSEIINLFVEGQNLDTIVKATKQPREVVAQNVRSYLFNKFAQQAWQDEVHGYLVQIGTAFFDMVFDALRRVEVLKQTGTVEELVFIMQRLVGGPDLERFNNVNAVIRDYDFWANIQELKTLIDSYKVWLVICQGSVQQLFIKYLSNEVDFAAVEQQVNVWFETLETEWFDALHKSLQE